MSSTGRPEFNAWWSVYGGEFVAHATKHSDDVCKNRVVKCAEEIFRISGSVEYETNNGIGPIRKMRSELGNAPCMYSYLLYNRRFEVDREGPREPIRYPNAFVIPSSSIQSGWVNVESILEKNPNSLVHEHGSFTSILLENEDWINPFNESDYKKQYELLSEKSHLSAIEAVSVMRPFRPRAEDRSIRSDEQDNRRIDCELRDIYDYCLQDHLSKDHLSFALYEMRVRMFGYTLCPEIRTSKNSIRWAYGPVAILKGRPAADLAWAGCYFTPSGDHSEFLLKEPYQVSKEEGFYKIHLEDPSVVLVGKDEAIRSMRLDPNIDGVIKNKMFSLSELTNDQRAALINS